MPTTTSSPNMNMPVPIVGADLGPQYAIDINTCLSLIDSHDHSNGNGAKISQAGINITGDVAFNGFNATLLRTTRFSSQGAALAVASDLNCAYVVGNDLYFNDGLGNQIRMTQSGGVAGTPGSIAGLAAPASATYIPASTKFVWQSNMNTSADMDIGSLIIRQNSASANGITISSPAALAANYSLTLFPSLPSTKRQVSVDASGNITSDVYSSFYDAQNYIINATVASNAMTIALKTLAGTDPSSTDTVKIGFRSATASSGAYVARTVSAATSLVVSSGSTLGTTSATNSYLYVYALDNGGTVELAISMTMFTDGTVQSTTAEGGAGAADSGSVMYSTTARSNVAIRLLARLLVNQTTAGTWAAVPTQINLQDFAKEPVNIASSSDINGVATTSTSYVDVTNSSLTITTSGRPVMIMLTQANSTGVASKFGGAWASVTANSRPQCSFYFILVGDGSQVGGEMTFDYTTYTGTSTAAGSWHWPHNSIWIDQPAAGTHTYKLQFKQSGASNLTSPQAEMFGRLRAIEL